MSGSQDNSVGIVKPQRFDHRDTFALQSGQTLQGFSLVYETYGALNENKDNAVLICHALSGNHHAAGWHSAADRKPGWWDQCIGPGKAIDTNLFFVVSLNNLGGCDGSTGPNSIDPATGEAFGSAFPTVTVSDWVKSQALLADYVGIQRFAAVIGGSLGGMQALQWAIDYPNRLYAAVVIASAANLTAQNIAFNELARQAILTDENFRKGDYYADASTPSHGLMLARMIGHVTYLSDNGMDNRFGRDLRSGDLAVGENVQFEVESYLNYQGRAFTEKFDANTYLLMTRALDYFDPARTSNNNLSQALADVTAKFMIVSFTSDWRFSTQRSTEIVDALIASNKDVVSAVIESEHGHDSFLLPLPRYIETLKTYLQCLHQAHCTSDSLAAEA